jgi:inositol oxygenase
MIRYHSAYPWHTGGAYRQFMNSHDHAMLPWILEFNKYDLYTKNDAGLNDTSDGSNLENLWNYYEDIIAKYFPCPELVW